MIVNVQRKVKIDVGQYSTFVDSLTVAVDEARGRSFSIAFVSDRRMADLNRFFRGKESTTDVLSFPHEADEFVQTEGFSTSLTEEARTLNADFLGDIVISVEQAKRQADENGLSLENEIKQLILHGLLHLCGYDHETDDGGMNKRELKLRRKLKI